MSLKDLISTLIESVFDSKKAFVAHQALPQGEIGHVTVQLQNVDGWTYIPPADGYLSADIFSAEQVFLHSGLLSYVDAGNRKSLFIPVRKGEGVSVGSANYQSGSKLTFFPLIGGGINRLLAQAVRSVRGGGLCLNSSNTFVLSLIQQLPDLARVIRLTPYLFLLKAHQVFQLSLQLMVGVVYTFQGNSTEFTYGRIISSEVFLQPRGRMEVASATLQDVSRFAKGKQLLASLEELRNLLITSCTLQNDRCLNNAKEVCHG